MKPISDYKIEHRKIIYASYLILKYSEHFYMDSNKIVIRRIGSGIIDKLKAYEIEIYNRLHS